MNDEPLDVIIIGAGPAGMTAAVFTARKGLKTLVISKDIGGQVNWTSVVENYMGFKEIGGAELMNRFEEQMKGNHLIYKQDEAALLKPANGLMEVTGKKTGPHQGRAVIIATGKRPQMLNVPGEMEFRGKGVSYCSTCDAPLFRDAVVAVVGGGNSGLQSAIDLLGVGAKSVYLITDEELTGDEALIEKVRADQRVQTYPHCQVVAVVGDQFVNGLKIKQRQCGSEETLEVAGVFIEIGLTPNAEFIEGFKKNSRGEIEVDCQCQSSLDGVFAAGDVTNVPEKQIIVAAGEGAKAAIRVWERLIQQRVAAVPIGKT